MRQQAVIADADRESRAEVETDEQKEIDWTRPEPEGKQTCRMQSHDKKTLGPVQLRDSKRLLFGDAYLSSVL